MLLPISTAAFPKSTIALTLKAAAAAPAMPLRDEVIPLVLEGKLFTPFSKPLVSSPVSITTFPSAMLHQLPIVGNIGTQALLVSLYLYFKFFAAFTAFTPYPYTAAHRGLIRKNRHLIAAIRAYDTDHHPPSSSLRRSISAFSSAVYF